MRKIILLAVLFVYLLFPSETFAQNNFNVDVKIEYDVKESGNTFVTNHITLENAGSDVYATSYKLKLNNASPTNIKAFYKEKEEELSVSGGKINDNFTLEVVFDDAIVGKNESRSFVISYEEDSIATRTGEVWEISIPKLENEDDFRSYDVILTIPSFFGDEAFISPEPKSRKSEENTNQYTFDKNGVSSSGIAAGFGEFQVFSFTLVYHLENPLNKTSPVTIAIPPDTSFQKVIYEQIEPSPEDVTVDSDGNWLAHYKMGSRDRLDITAKGSVQLFGSPRKLLVQAPENLSNNLLSTQYWQTDNPNIQNLANQLKTPKNIYDFVTDSLTYDYDRVRPNVQRYGASKALENPSSAICMEFTDTFIAIARSAGIPAREINGFAYTENPEIQPLSLVADVLHSWPEYWDEKRGIWVPIDPTWGSTTNGVDYFSKLDLRHFTFVIHGENPTMPFSPGSYKLGPNPQKDVFVSFGQLPEKRNSNLEIITTASRLFPFMSTKISVLLKNPGPTALYDIRPRAIFDGEVAQDFYIDTLPPFGERNLQVFIPFSFFGTNTPDSVEIVAAGSSVKVPSHKNRIIIYNLLAVSVLILTVIVLVLIKSGRLKTKKIKKSLNKYAKSIKGSKKNKV